MIYNEFHPPLPRVSKRDIVAMKIWVPHGLSRDMKCGEITFMIPNKILRPLKECTVSTNQRRCVVYKLE